ncbi:MAG: alpha-glucan family phosphorylase [Pseudomonadota bacterium]|nr:alpha-glucan family phosphorylase [Pseudomonadota bacterium]
MTGVRDGYLFEVSWEVCNKVGGIYTVIASKLREALKVYGDRYILLGPDLKTNVDFEETDEACWTKIREGTAIKDLPCRFGRWKIDGEPKAILVSAGKKYDKDQLLYRLWEAFGVDSIAGGWDYEEPVMFSFACGEVIETIYNVAVRPYHLTAVAHFHEWMTGAGLLYLKKRVPEVGTVFTTHATILGRSLAGAGVDIYGMMEHIAPQREASVHNITAKYSMETVTAREADCFTTVSEITAAEAKNFLSRTPDFITPNALDMDNIPDYALNRMPAENARERLLAAAARFLRRELPPETRILIISGRYEYRNKGIDLFLEALGRLEREGDDGPGVLALLFVLGGYTDLIPPLRDDAARCETGKAPLATHRLHNEGADPILQACNRLGLANQPGGRVQIIFNPAYLNGHDGLINMSYYEALSGCDLGVFPSYYEPWGYTPLESVAYGVPTVTTDQAGFGIWCERTHGDSGGVMLLRRRGQPRQSIEDHLFRIIVDFLGWTPEETAARRRNAREVALRANWGDFFGCYLRAYNRAESSARSRAEQAAAKAERTEARHVYAGAVSSQPHFRAFTAVANLPKRIVRLREMAYNLWWTWNPWALDLYATLDLKLWAEMGNNPVRMLESVSPEILREAAANATYLGLYDRVIQQFDEYLGEKGPRRRISAKAGLRWASPVAYFSAEYGLHECLPIYSGGLGTLSGDHLKTASDLNLPLVAVGLLYRNGYFRQAIDEHGRQTETYPENDFSTMPVRIVQDDRGKEVQIAIDLPGRTLFANIWEVKVGKVSLYLLDADVPRNTPQDRTITARLYNADQKTRIEQEILLGVGGVRLLKKLGIRPRVYHINEGHSAFLVLERIESLMQEENLTFEEAAEVVRASSVFTTHTPVEAGNERFSRELMEHYFSGFIKRSGLSWARFWELGRRRDGEETDFFMNILAFKMTIRSNAVSLVHGQVSRRMWREVWKGFDDADIPIRHITNGVHVLSYLAPRMRNLLDAYLGMDWERNLHDPERWRRVQDIPDALLWRVRYELKQKTIDLIREDITRRGAKYGPAHVRREELFSRLNSGALMIGIARRFAPYKRADMILADLDRLDRIVNHPHRPVHLVFAGKAHPNDGVGKHLVEKVMGVCRDDRFRGRVFFLENYDIRVARHLVQGVDLWLNNPRRPLEASGTSGMKVVINGVLNLSVSDGWWVEGYNGANGWTIGPALKGYEEPPADADAEDGQSLYNILENIVIPTFYDRDAAGMPVKWLTTVKQSMQSLAPRFNTDRMLQEYLQDMYGPASQRECELAAEGHALARRLADWKGKLPMRFSSLRLVDVSVEGIHGDTIMVDQPLKVSARIDPGKLAPEEILVEIMIGRRNGHDFVQPPECVPLEIVGRSPEGILTFSTDYVVRENGLYNYGLRVIPRHESLASKLETGLILWG